MGCWMSENWTVNYHRDLAKEIRRLPKPTVKRLLETIESLATDPRPPDCQKVEGYDLWRIRIGDYRILYQIDEENRTVNSYRVGHRKHVYRNL
jgi:mRNA interferase RelE/StbE